MITFSPKLPVWYQLSAMLRADILAGRLARGTRIESEVELARRYGVSVMPVRQAFRALEKERLIVRQRGRGTFVSDGAPRAIEGVTSLEALYSREFTRPALILERGAGPTPSAFARHFPGVDNLSFVRRLAFRDDQPWSYGSLFFLSEFDDWMPTSLLRCYPLYRIVQERCGVKLTRSQFDAQATMASPEVAEMLGLDPLSPVLSLSAATFDDTNRAIGAFQMHFRSAPFVFSFETAHL